jgi:hypothetical protein
MTPMFFKSPQHRTRFLSAMQQLGKVEEGKLDPEYASALYLLTSDGGTWQKANTSVSRTGIAISAMLEEVDVSGGYSVLIKLAGNLFNGQMHLDPLEFLRLDEGNFRLALSSLTLRRSSFHLDDFKEGQSHEWIIYMTLLEQSQETPATHCVSCWYEEHQEAFPALDSSSLCSIHADAVRAAFSEQRKAVRI